MSPSYEVVATDLDGTIVRADGTVSDRTRAGLDRARAAGARLVLVTGRPMRWLPGVADATGHRGVALCANGAIVADLATGEVVASRLIERDAALAVVDALRAAIPEVSFAVERVGQQFSHEAAYRPRWDDGDHVVAPLDELLDGEVVKVLARHETMNPDELMARARDVLGESMASVTHSSTDGLLEIGASGVTKATGLAAYCDDLGVAAAAVLAFGDMPNDLPMLTWAGHGVAVANAHPDVLAVADEVTAGVEDDGVAQVLEREFGG